MSQAKKVMATLLAILIFVMVTVFFTSVLHSGSAGSAQQAETIGVLTAYPRPVTEPTEETQTEPTETRPTEPPETEPVVTEPRFVYDAVPLFYMSDYPDILYRSGTVATSGSNIASLAMVASYLTGNEYRPDELADYFANYIGNSMQWL